VPISPDLDPACRAGNTAPGTVLAPPPGWNRRRRREVSGRSGCVGRVDGHGCRRPVRGVPRL